MFDKNLYDTSISVCMQSANKFGDIFMASSEQLRFYSVNDTADECRRESNHEDPKLARQPQALPTLKLLFLRARRDLQESKRGNGFAAAQEEIHQVKHRWMENSFLGSITKITK